MDVALLVTVQRCPDSSVWTSGVCTVPVQRVRRCRSTEEFNGFLGIRELEFIYAEGLAMGEAPREDALSDAGERIRRLAA